MATNNSGASSGPMDPEKIVEFYKMLNPKKYASNTQFGRITAELRDFVNHYEEELQKKKSATEESGSQQSAAGGAGDDKSKMKLIVVGDGAVGKTCLLTVFQTNEFPEKYLPTVFSNCIVDTKWQNHDVKLHVWDTAGQEEYDRLRPLSYPNTDVVLICFSVVSVASFEAVKSKWAPEITHYLPDTTKILVGLKIDLRDAKVPDVNTGKVEPITTDMGKELAKAIKAVCYCETSSRTKQGLQEVFNTAIGEVMQYRFDDGADDDTSSTASDTNDNSKKGKKDKKEEKEGKNQKKKKKKSGCMLQ